MSDINITKFLLDLEDENLIPDENSCTGYVTLPNGITAKLLKLKSTTPFVVCPECGQILTALHDYRTVQIKHYTCGKQPLIVSIRKKRFKCLDCNLKVTEELSLVNKHCFISNGIKRSILASLTEVGSLKGIAVSHNVSQTTVYQALNKVPPVRKTLSLSPVLSFDEFRANTTDGKYAFMVVDPIGKKILEILPSRRFSQVYSFFARFSRKERNKVKFIVIDLWKPYEKVIRKLFPHATLVADKFHYQRLVNRSLNEIRKQACSRMDSKTAYQVKKNWRLLGKSFDKVDDREKRYSHLLRRYATDYEVLNHILSLDSQLDAAHGLYQEFLCLISLSDQKLQVTMLKNWIHKAMASEIQELQSNARTFSQWFEAIASSFDHYEGHKLSNAFIEGTNNKIKVIKRVSFGYRSFINFRKRILLICSCC